MKSNVYYVTQGVLFFIFNCCSWFVWLTDDQSITKQGSEWTVSAFKCDQKKRKENMESAVWKFTRESVVVHSTQKEYGN